ncbi:MAG: hypothetical protein H0U70_09030 [Tatlockia sp.]|nr:hypothetical protein [Tatlockia sp.]
MTIIEPMVKKPRPSFNPRFAGAIFFAIYAVFLMLFCKYTLLTFLPLISSMLSSLVVGLISGFFIGKWLAKPAFWPRPFIIGILVASFLLILIAFFILLHGYLSELNLLNRLEHKKDYLILYAAIFASLATTIGLWFLPLTGLVAVYFNKKFFPGLVAADNERWEISKSVKKPYDH